ncbi:heavy metal translocating P-type ATPase [Candidatus Uabimicrobium sp. HlEnr_7]|uniref:heavy metal translocating P-type ATPase n=1 Tax=Candidatus Uabimicrobium helgolandensis TaxID=3095367 RepID=UPI00355770B7
MLKLSKFLDSLDHIAQEYVEKTSQKKLLKQTGLSKKNSFDLVLTKLDNKLHIVVSSHKYLQDWLKADSKEEQNSNERVTIGATSVAFMVAGGLYYPPLLVVGLGPALYNFIPLIQTIKQQSKEKRYFTTHTTFFAFILASLVTQQYWSLCLVSLLLPLSEKLIIRSEHRAETNLTSLFSHSIQDVWILIDSQEVKIPIDQLNLGDTVVIQSGETIPIDGKVVCGQAVVDQHILTGESQPVEKEINDSVFSSTFVFSGKIYVEVETMGKDTIVEKIGEMLHQTKSYKNEIISRGERECNRAALPILVGTAASIPFVGLSNALAILCAPFGFAMFFIAPVSMLNFLNIASQSGIFVKDGRSFEILSEVDTIVFDKTGTLTVETPTVYKIHLYNEYQENEILAYSATAEFKQTHPIAKAIISEAHNRGLTLLDLDDVYCELGFGIRAIVSDQEVIVGSLKFLEQQSIKLPEKIYNNIDESYSVVFVAINEVLAGAIELKTHIRKDVKETIDYLKRNNYDLYIISGDRDKPTQKIAKELGIENYFADVLPQEKASIVTNLQQQGKKVCFMGDGINDAIVLKKANVSISLRDASGIAVDNAQIIIQGENFNQVRKVIEFSNEYNSNVDRTSSIVNTFGCFSIASVFLFSHALIPSLVLAETGFFIGVGNALIPWYRFNKKNRSK